MRNSALKRLKPYVRQHQRKLVWAVALSLVGVVIEARIPIVIGDVINIIDPIDNPTGGVAQPGSLLPLVVLILAMGAAESILAYMRRNSLSRASHGVETELRNDLYAHLQRLHVGFHDGWQSGQLLSRAIQDINAVRRFVGFALPFLVILSLQVVYVFYLMFNRNPQLAMMSLVGVLPIGVVSYRFAKRYRKISREVQEDQGDLTTVIEEAATGIRIIKAFGRGPEQREKFRAQAQKLWDSSMGWVRLTSRLWPLFGLFPSLTYAVVLTIGGLTVINDGGFGVGGLMTFILLVKMTIWPIDAMGWILAMTEEARTASDRLFEVFDTQPSIQDREGATFLETTTGRVGLQDVRFRYEGGRDWILQGVNLEVEPGETLALVGKTGCGKTTLAMLIPRLYDVSEGKITIDGVDIRDVQVASLRGHVGVAFEDPILFSASVRENLVMGRPNSSDEEIREALETAQATFVYELPWGLDTRVGEQGHTLSGGQRQRLALARAVLGKPSVLVLDDPLSSVDVHTEALIEEALHSVLSGVTAVLVAHRPSTLALADRVALLDEGRIVAVGPHRELMATDPLYRSILSQEAEDITAETTMSTGGGVSTIESDALQRNENE